MDEYDFAISLGSECYTNSPFIKSNYGIDKKYYISTPLCNVRSHTFKKVLHLLYNKFSDLLDNKLLVKTDIVYKNQNMVENAKYDIHFYHENVIDDKHKMTERIERMTKLLSLHQHSVLFIRIENYNSCKDSLHAVLNNCKHFIKIIKTQYSLGNFKLLYIFESTDVLPKKSYLYKTHKHCDIYIVPKRK